MRDTLHDGQEGNRGPKPRPSHAGARSVRASGNGEALHDEGSRLLRVGGQEPGEAFVAALFDLLVDASGLSPIFARSTLKRACERAGVNVETMTKAELVKALPNIRKALETFIPVADVDTRMRAISKLANLP